MLHGRRSCISGQIQGLTFRVIHTGIEGYPRDRRVSLYKSARYGLVQGVAYAVELVA